ncbi:uncharacterized protein [Cardiocondyla obscurior]|uniref:uncharacterized protein n=1 Tax=Cardiocondyla obscurior TaxID=286306 RepID=UPI0039655CBB
MCFLHKIHLRSHKLATGDRCVSLWVAPSNLHQYHGPPLQRAQKHQKQTPDKPHRFADGGNYRSSFQSCPWTERRPDAEGRGKANRKFTLKFTPNNAKKRAQLKANALKRDAKIEHERLRETKN